VVNRVVVWQTNIYYPNEGRTQSAPLREGITTVDDDKFTPYRFWLVPLAKRGSKITVSVLDVCSHNPWNRSSHQFIVYSSLQALKAHASQRGTTRPAGAARIRLDRALSGAEPASERLSTVVVIIRQKLARLGSMISSHGAELSMMMVFLTSRSTTTSPYHGGTRGTAHHWHWTLVS
jgi:hypothetical protein